MYFLEDKRRNIEILSGVNLIESRYIEFCIKNHVLS